MRLFVACCLLAIASAVDQCAWGESYWCSGLRQAKDCGAFQHCFTTVWENQQLPKDNTDVCQFCEGLVKDVRDFITDKQSWDQIKRYLESACSIIPDADLAKKCKGYVDNDLDELLDLITSELDPQVVCALIGLCKGLEDHVQHSMPANRVPSMKIPAAQLEPICTDCKKFLQDIKDLATSPTYEKELEQLLEQNLCAQLGAFEDECKALVEAYIPELMQLMTSEFDPAQICGMMGFCNSSTKAMLAKMRLQKSPLYKEAQKVSDGAECEICKNILAEIQTLDRDPKIQTEVKTFLKEEICARLGSMKAVCEDTVDTYAPELFELIATELDPTTRCQSLGFCSASNKVSAVRENTAVAGAVPNPRVTASAQCVLCEFVMKELDSILSNNATQEEIMQALDKVCSLLPKTLSQECTDFVNTYAKAIIAMLEQELDPQEICTALGLCKAEKIDMKVKVNPEVCLVCETIFGYLDAILEQNATIDEIEAALEKVCNFLPQSYRTQCDNIVEKYGPAIVQMLAEFVDPKEICTLLHLCNDTITTQNHKAEIVAAEILPAKAHLLGVNECTYGPAFWCASRENAEKCKAVEHCKNHVWN